MAACPSNHPIHPDFANGDNPHCCRCHVEGQLPAPAGASSVQSNSSVPIFPMVSYEDIEVSYSVYFDPPTATVYVDLAVWDVSDGGSTLIGVCMGQPIWIALPPVSSGGSSQGLPPFP